jgi:hypothetical protein
MTTLMPSPLSDDELDEDETVQSFEIDSTKIEVIQI